MRPSCFAYDRVKDQPAFVPVERGQFESAVADGPVPLRAFEFGPSGRVEMFFHRPDLLKKKRSPLAAGSRGERSNAFFS
jgi:hypothetical protein